MAEFRLTARARADLADIADYGILTFGERRSQAYRAKLQDRLERLAEEPLLSPKVDHIATGLRRSAVGSHAIYYRPAPWGILVLRILGRQDPFVALRS